MPILKISDLLFTLILFFTLTVKSQSTLLESQTIDSEILNRSVEYSILLPSDYDSSSRSYPVLYLLHGYTDDETGWTQYGEVKKIVDTHSKDIEVTEMIIVMPDAGLDWYINTYDKENRYEDFFIDEFIPYIDNTYRTRPTQQSRAISGLSMGGHGTYLYAMKHPDVFCAAAPLSAAAWEEEEITSMPQKDWDQYFGYLFGPDNSGEARLTDHLRSNMAYFLAKAVPAEELKKTRWYIDCGDDDFLINGNMNMHRILTEKEVPHEFRVRDGGHTWTYWRTALPEVLKFVSESFHR